MKSVAATERFASLSAALHMRERGFLARRLEHR